MTSLFVLIQDHYSLDHENSSLTFKMYIFQTSYVLVGVYVGSM